MQSDLNLLSYVAGAIVGSLLVAAVAWRLLRNKPRWHRWGVVVCGLFAGMAVAGTKAREHGATQDAEFVSGFQSSCAQRCVTDGGPAELCAQLCACQLTNLRATSTVAELRRWMASHIVNGAPDSELQQRMVEVSAPCTEQLVGKSAP